MQSLKFFITIVAAFCVVWGSEGCKKLVQAPQPLNTITTAEVFSDEATATAALVGIYNDMTTGHSGSMAYGNGLTSMNVGLSADELEYFNINDPLNYPFQSNQLLSTNVAISFYFWNDAYFNIYEANAIIEGLQASTTLSASFKSQMTAESEFLRAFANFYLVNLFGAIPLLTSINYSQNSTLPRAATSEVYAQIVSDLQYAEKNLPLDYSVSQGSRIRANQWAAAALLARVYLYLGNWAGADSATSAVIANTGLFSLDSLNAVFLANSTEAIWQLAPNANSQYATFEGNQIIPDPVNSGLGYYYLTPTLLSAFEPGDERFSNWLDSTNYTGTEEYYPYKYKVKTASAGNVPEYYMMLRLGEQFLIRAEAEAHGAQGGTAAAILDLDTIRNRAGLPDYSGAMDSTSVLTAIMHERQVELFAEWGHRWLDLKRWGNAQQVLTANKGYGVTQGKLLYPIPKGELTTDPNLVQNSSY